MARYWPSVVSPAKVSFFPELVSASGGPAFGGSEQVVFSSAGRWRAQLQMSVRLRHAGGALRERVLAARATVAYLKGRSNTIYIGPYDSFNAPGAIVGISQSAFNILHSDGSPFSDGFGYTQIATYATLAAALAQGAMAATIALSSTGEIVAGQYFGLGSSELYLIDSASFDGVNYDVTFWPPARTAHLAGEQVNFDTPTCEMRLAADSSGQLAFAPGFVADQELDLVEAL